MKTMLNVFFIMSAVAFGELQDGQTISSVQIPVSVLEIKSVTVVKEDVKAVGDFQSYGGILEVNALVDGNLCGEKANTVGIKLSLAPNRSRELEILRLSSRDPYSNVVVGCQQGLLLTEVKFAFRLGGALLKVKDTLEETYTFKLDKQKNTSGAALGTIKVSYSPDQGISAKLEK